jgi:hypothetical protein
MAVVERDVRCAGQGVDSMADTVAVVAQRIDDEGDRVSLLVGNDDPLAVKKRDSIGVSRAFDRKAPESGGQVKEVLLPVANRGRATASRSAATWRAGAGTAAINGYRSKPDEPGIIIAVGTRSNGSAVRSMIRRASSPCRA